MTTNELYIGLMSGTSADAIDSVLVDFSASPKILETFTQVLSADMRARIHGIATPGENEIERLGVLDVELGELFAQAVNKLLLKAEKLPGQISAIGSHGQTIRHRPSGHAVKPFTLQIGDPNTIAHLTNITTVADFRRRDMAAGGQGAPLVPAFHQSLFHSAVHNRVIVNIGGMANITGLSRDGAVIGFDTGPGNVLMDFWTQTHLGKSYDKSGEWAARGKFDDVLVKSLLAHPFFSQQPPKSTGRETFNNEWLMKSLVATDRAIAPQDVQASLLELTAQSISQSIDSLDIASPKQIFVCGGGAYNSALMHRLTELMCDCQVQSTSNLGIAPEWIEAMAFAWLARQTINKKPGNLCAVTGAKEAVILGGIYLA